MKQIIIGSGAAGIAAAKTIRNIHKNDEITLVSSDETIYSRCMLHKYSGNERDEASLSFVPADFFTTNNIHWYSGESVKSIDTKNNRIQLQNTTLPYDNLLIATGSEAVIPNIGQFRTATNVYGYRHLTDAKTIREKAPSAEKILIVGAGLIGLDVAYALLKLKKTVTVVEMAPQIMPLNLDSTSVAVYQKLFEQNGCTFRLNSKITNTQSNANGAITHITLETGENLACDMVIVAAGVRPSIKLLEGSGIEYDRSIKVDQYLKTSCENVYAAGSVTGLGEIWQSAVRQGEVAAKNMCNIKTQFTDTFTAKNTINFFDLPTLSVGNINPENGDTIHLRIGSNYYQKIILKNNFIAGIILQGNLNHSGIWQYLIKNKIDVSHLKKPIETISFADFYAIDTDGQYKYNCPTTNQQQP
jgi:NAD(P)H-nitrite reductase large subunit